MEGGMVASEDTSSGGNILVGGERLTLPTIRPQSGGKSDPPQSFFDVGMRLRPQIAEAWRTLSELPDALHGPRLYFETSVVPNYLATSHFPEALFSLMGVRRVGTRSAYGTYVTKQKREENALTKSFLLSGSAEALTRLDEQLGANEASLSRGVHDDLLKLQDVAAPSPGTVLNLGAEQFIEVEKLVALESVLHPVVDEYGFPDSNGLAEVLAKWAALIESLGGSVDLDERRTHQDLSFVPVLLPRERIQEAARFNPLRTLQPMPTMEVRPPDELRGIGGITPLPPSDRPTTSQRIAIFDGGLPDTVPALAPYVSYVDLTNGAPDLPESTSHATTVASAAAFGNIDQAAGLEPPPAYLDHFRVWPPPAQHRPDQHMNWVIDEITKQVQTGQHTLVSLSIGPQFNIDPEGPPHRWTAALDELAERFNVLFCVAAGNQGEGDPAIGENLLGIPADTINGLSVGSCDDPDLSDWVRAPYSSVGPGRAGARVAPQVLSCGGLLPDKPFTCLIPGGQYAYSHGTSLATPSVARSLAELRHALGSHASANTLRAFAVHHADRRSELALNEVGYGRIPRSLLEDLSCTPQEATILYEDRLRRGETVMLTLPIPDDLLDELGARYVDLRWTLAFTSPVDVSDPVDYSRAGIEMRFRPHAETFNMNLKGEDPIRVNRRDPNNLNLYDHLVKEGRVPSERPLSRGLREYAPEAEQRVRKWETMIRVDDHMKASTLYRPTLDLHLLTRSAGNMTPASSGDELNYSMLVTVAVSAGVQLYDRVKATAEVLTPLTVGTPVIVTS
jgi:hypothetical protein